MAAKNFNNGENVTNERQRFYIELNPDETTIVSWKKLLKQAARDKNDLSFQNSTTTDDNHDGGEYNDPICSNKRVKPVNRAASSSCRQQIKRRVDLTIMEGQKNGHTSIKPERSDNMSAKTTFRATNLLDETCRPFTSPALMKDRPPEELQAHMGDAHLLTYSKKFASFGNKSKCQSVLHSVENPSVFPLKTTHSVLQDTRKISSEKSRMKVRVGSGSSNVIHQNSKGRHVPVDFNAKPGMPLLDKVSSKSLYNDNNDGTKELVGAIGPGYKMLKNSADVLTAIDDTTLVRLFNQVLEEAIQELEDVVAKSKVLHCEALDGHASWLVVERELPPEVKSKLDKVQSDQGTVSEELIKRLVTILGKLVHGKTLKRCWRKVVVLKLLMPKEKAEKFEDIKSEILAKVSNQQFVASIPEAKEKQRFLDNYRLDSDMEDKLCDLHDIFYQELGAEKYVQVQKMFFEIVDLWPEGVMDYYKLKEGIRRAKCRRVIANTNRCPTVLNDIKKNPDELARQKSNVSVSSNKNNPIPSLPRKTAPKRATTEQPVPQHKSSPSVTKGVKLNFKIPEKRNVKVKFLLKKERETLKSTEKSVDTASRSSFAVQSRKPST